MNLGPNEGLIGVPGSRWRLSTPALLLDVDAFDKNIRKMAGYCRTAGCHLRPHLKGPKSVNVAKRQMAAGAIGVTCATLGEAEIMVDAEISGVLVTSPIVTGTMIDRLIALNSRSDALMVVADNPQIVDAFDAAARKSGKALAVLIDYDVGQRRTGAATEQAAVNLAARISKSNSLEYMGLQAYYGHLQGTNAFDERELAVTAQVEKLRSLSSRLAREGLELQVVSGGGTGTFAIDLGADFFTELQPGSYPFMDAQYDKVEITKEDPRPFEIALFVQATVVSTNQAGTVTINAGMKAVPTDGVPPWFTVGARRNCRYSPSGDEFGFVHYEKPEDDYLSVGDVIECVTPHCDTTTNLYNVLHCVQGDELVDIWPIHARGRW